MSPILFEIHNGSDSPIYMVAENFDNAVILYRSLFSSPIRSIKEIGVINDISDNVRKLLIDNK